MLSIGDLAGIRRIHGNGYGISVKLAKKKEKRETMVNLMIICERINVPFKEISHIYVPTQDESMDDGDDVNDKLSFGAKIMKVIESMVLIVYLGVWKWVKTGCLVNLSERKVLGQSGFPAYVFAGSGSDGLIRRIHRNGYGVLKV
uniref:Uncharacterized protein n=1 Tax=Tanacetum cinerariifolium TaxID=118510 RepID=A0A699H3R8_TANCI|nr:hypothetical protein [Tanacetum cinerariifolium]